MPERRGSCELRCQPLVAGLRHPQRSPPGGRSAVWGIGRRSTLSYCKHTQEFGRLCTHRPGEILKPLNNRNASPAEWRGGARQAF